MIPLALPGSAMAVAVSPPSYGAGAPSGALAECVESTIEARPLSPRDTVKRKTFAKKGRPSLRRHRVAKRPTTAKTTAAKPRPVKLASIKRKTVAKRTLGKRPTALARRAHARKAPTQLASIEPIRKLTYVSPFCGSRVAAIDTYIDNLPQIDAIDAPTASAIAPENVASNGPDFIDTLNPNGPGTGNGGNGISPNFPGVIIPGGSNGGGGGGNNGGGTNPGGGNGESGGGGENGPGSGGGGNQPIAPPVASVPEPSSWATMIAGFMLIGLTQRRRARRPVTATH
jgi:hypothetical protein